MGKTLAKGRARIDTCWAFENWNGFAKAAIDVRRQTDWRIIEAGETLMRKIFRIMELVASAAIIAAALYILIPGASVAFETSGGTFGILLILAIFISFMIYFIPSIIAHSRHHQNAIAITVLNVFLGWTFIGWVVALVWSFTEVR